MRWEFVRVLEVEFEIIKSDAEASPLISHLQLLFSIMKTISLQVFSVLSYRLMYAALLSKLLHEID